MYVKKVCRHINTAMSLPTIAQVKFHSEVHIKMQSHYTTTNILLLFIDNFFFLKIYLQVSLTLSQVSILRRIQDKRNHLNYRNIFFLALFMSKISLYYLYEVARHKRVPKDTAHAAKNHYDGVLCTH